MCVTPLVEASVCIVLTSFGSFDNTHDMCWVLSVKCWNSKYTFSRRGILFYLFFSLHCSVCLCLQRSGSNCTGTFFRCLPVYHLIGAVSTYKVWKHTAGARQEGEKHEESEISWVHCEKWYEETPKMERWDRWVRDSRGRRREMEAEGKETGG